jgi:hypothetical protein
MRKYALFFSLTIYIGLTQLSCTKVVDINLNDAAPKIIIEGGLSDIPASCSVKVSKTVNFDQPNDFPPVTGAVVTITEDFGDKTALTEISAGLYKADLYRGISGKTYTVSVTAEGKTYTASSKMAYPTAIDTIIPERVSWERFGKTETLNYVIIKYQDPKFQDNYYRFIEKINSTISTDIMIDNDILRDGNVINQQIYSENPLVQEGDTITIYLQTIEKDIYNYFEQLRQVTSQDRGGQPAAPANPTSNFNNGALGYFSAHAVRSKKIIMP